MVCHTHKISDWFGGGAGTSLRTSLNVLTDAPQNTGRVEKTKITHLPGLKLDGGDSDTILFHDTTGTHLLPPSVNILYKVVHHKVFSKGFYTMAAKSAFNPQPGGHYGRRAG